jgi:hypothetical protein
MSGSGYDVAVVGGGPAGCSAGVFAARAGLETVIYDRGRSSLRQCAHLENYLGFPGGIDVETFYELSHAHAEAAGCELRRDLVESVDRDGDGFVVDPQERAPVTADRVIAATRYDPEYLRGLDDGMFETFEHDGESRERFDREYPGRDGSTPVGGLYVASPSTEADTQAIMAAGRGARVAQQLIADARIAAGWWEAVADSVDWVRREANRTDEWADRDRWVAYFDAHYGENAPVDTDSDRFERVREEYIDEALAAYITEAEIERRAGSAHRELAAALDAADVAAAFDAPELLEAIDDDDIREYLASADGDSGVGP